MRRIGVAILAAWMAWPAAVSAHDVPDLVNVAIFFKPQNGRLQMVVRVPSNAFIDFQFPVLDATWLDLSVSEAIAAAAVKVWVADRVSLFENGIALPKPTIVKTRISRMNDPFFGSFDDALIHTSGPRKIFLGFMTCLGDDKHAYVEVHVGVRTDSFWPKASVEDQVGPSRDRPANAFSASRRTSGSGTSLGIRARTNGLPARIARSRPARLVTKSTSETHQPAVCDQFLGTRSGVIRSRSPVRGLSCRRAGRGCRPR